VVKRYIFDFGDRLRDGHGGNCSLSSLVKIEDSYPPRSQTEKSIIQATLMIKGDLN